jgi:alpha-galactosidase
VNALSHIRREARFTLGKIIVRYTLEDDDVVSFAFHPAGRTAELVPKRITLDEPEVARLPQCFLLMPARTPDSLVQLSVRGPGIDFSPPLGFANGLTMRGGEASSSLQFKAQLVERSSAGTSIVTELRSSAGFKVNHFLEWCEGDGFFRVWTEFHNISDRSLTLDMLASFSFSGVTPFHPSDAPGRLWVHRVRSAWSAEGRVDSRRVEELHMERSWAGTSVSCERFGAIGSMPARGYFPIVAVEDRGAGVTWGAQLGIASSWQMEVFRRGDDLSVSGGIADREFGHWWKTVEPGDSFATPKAMLAVVSGDLQDVCHALTSSQEAAVDLQPESERALPVVFNEWCSSWGNPTHENIRATARHLCGFGVRYFVIDDGWAERPGAGFQQNGDWNINRMAFSDGLKATCDAIRAEGMVPGIWFEFEVCNEGSNAWSLTDHQLRRDGRVLRVGTRRFWDFRDPWTFVYLADKVIRLLGENGFGYLKVDYNDTLGVGVDGPEGDGPGEHLRQHVAAVQEFFREIRRQLPGLVIENCSSGGHRLVASMQELCAMGSFSDAHETPEIPIIAANQHKVVLPRQLQVWAVLRREDRRERTEYSLAATFLGRMALSGDMTALGDEPMSAVREALSFYQMAVPVIVKGRSRLLECPVGSWRHPEGRQVFMRVSEDGNQALVVIHTFADPPASGPVVKLPGDEWRIAASFGSATLGARLEHSTLIVPPCPAFNGMAIFLETRRSAR